MIVDPVTDEIIFRALAIGAFIGTIILCAFFTMKYHWELWTAFLVAAFTASAGVVFLSLVLKYIFTGSFQ